MSVVTRKAAKALAAKGRFGDKYLLHVSPDELFRLAETGKVTVNPETGLPEAFGFGSIGDFIGNIGSGVNDFINKVTDTASDLTGNPLGVPGFDTNMISNPTDFSGFAPVTQLAALAGGAELGAGAFSGAGGLGLAPGEVSTTLPSLTKAGGLLELGKGYYGMQQARELQKRISEDASRSDPFAARRSYYQQKLDELMNNPSAVQNIPGYQAGLDAVMRTMAANGYLGSGNMMTAMMKQGGSFFNDYLKQLMDLSGVNYHSDAGQILATGDIDAAKMRGQALNSLMYGARSVLPSISDIGEIAKSIFGS